jgi:orotate phosphoribosyltransferase
MRLKNAADAGCGVGFFSQTLAECGLNVCGFDGREENVAEARRRFPQIPFEQADKELGRWEVVLQQWDVLLRIQKIPETRQGRRGWEGRVHIEFTFWPRPPYIRRLGTGDWREFMKEHLLSLVSGRQGHFQLESGHHGDLWFQLETLCLNVREIRPFAVRLAEQLKKRDVEVVCGPLVEGAFVGLLVSLELGCEFVYAERFADTAREGLFPVEYRLPKVLQAAVKGKRVAIVNDVINAGSAVRGAFSDLLAHGANVVVIGALLALGYAIAEFATEHGVALELLERKPNNLWSPGECPLCVAGMPLEIVGTS